MGSLHLLGMWNEVYLEETSYLLGITLQGAPATITECWMSSALWPRFDPEMVITVPPSTGPDRGSIYHTMHDIIRDCQKETFKESIWQYVNLFEHTVLIVLSTLYCTLYCRSGNCYRPHETIPHITTLLWYVVKSLSKGSALSSGDCGFESHKNSTIFSFFRYL